MRDVLDVIQQQFRDRWDKPLLIDAVTNRTYTYAQFAAICDQLGNALIERGATRGSRISILLSNSPEFAALYIACLLRGFVAVPINPSLHRKEIESLFSRSGANIVVMSPATRVALGGAVESFTNCVIFEMLPERELVETNHNGPFRCSMPDGGVCFVPDFSSVSPDNLLSITFSSGTTAIPKAICHSVSTLLRSAQSFNSVLEMNSENRMYHILPMFYMAGFLNTLLCPIMAGGSIVLNRPVDAKLALQFWGPAIEHEVNTLWLVPTILTSLMLIDRSKEAPAWCRQHIRIACVGTAPLPFQLRKDFEARYGIVLLESYGLSETLFVTCNTPTTMSPPGSAGRVLPGVNLRIVSEKGDAMPLLSDGEILIQSPFSLVGYISSDTMAPDPVSRGEWFLSGDIGHLNADGDLFITNRKKDLIIRGGVNISPRAIEEVLQCHPAVEATAVIGMPHHFFGEQIVAVLKLRVGYDLPSLSKELAALCGEHLSATSQPDRYIEVSLFPTTATGKIQKSKLREILGAAGAGT